MRAAVASAAGSTDRLTFFAADLTADEGWEDAMAGCDYVLHVASPLGSDSSRDPDALIVPARDGTLRVLRAAVKAGVKRVVMTSAAAAARPPHGSDSLSDETVWADPTDRQFDAYRRSKILAERAAWDFMAGNTGPTILTTILPGAVFGPVLTTENLGSVRDHSAPAGRPSRRHPAPWILGGGRARPRRVARPRHDCAEAAAQRFIAAGDFMWMEDIATTLRSKLGSRASKVPMRRLPDLVFRLLSLFIPALRTFAPSLGRKNSVTSAKARRVLGFSPRPATTTVVDCAESLLRENV